MQFLLDHTTYHWFAQPAEYYYELAYQLPEDDHLRQLEATVQALFGCYERYADPEELEPFMFQNFFDQCPEGLGDDEVIVDFRYRGHLLDLYTETGRMYTADRTEWADHLYAELPDEAGEWMDWDYDPAETLPAGVSLSFTGSDFPHYFISHAQYAHYHQKAQAAVQAAEKRFLKGRSFWQWAKANSGGR